MNEEMEPTKEQKAQQAGHDVADTVARAAATYYGGAVGNKLYNAELNTQFVQNRLNAAGDKLSKNPILKNQQVQNVISNNKPLLDQTANTMGNNISTDTISNNTNSETANTATNAKNEFDWSQVRNTLPKTGSNYPLKNALIAVIFVAAAVLGFVCMYNKKVGMTDETKR